MGYHHGLITLIQILSVYYESGTVWNKDNRSSFYLQGKVGKRRQCGSKMRAQSSDSLRKMWLLCFLAVRLEKLLNLGNPKFPPQRLRGLYK